eukprot:CAMPEP_0184643886 /NCGR_PEP_ID=MMETSP0308-20130426/700_1 /TAXON_ID=38269 /ORGANISM="Gloeochaete witrockiana, Strain SAG 46.84" /LENGTH=402 /DNA_ID=CAMNT_0027072125 /DNA_START=206 /DNA_END=1414 /DNA_ORIENTATION=-
MKVGRMSPQTQFSASCSGQQRLSAVRTINMILTNPKETKKESSVEVAVETNNEELPALLVEDLKVSYRAKGGPVEAVKGISFSVRPGTVFGLLGPNASGKTTTIQCIVTLAKWQSGRIEAFGIPYATGNYRMIRQVLGYVPQDAGMDKVLTGREHMELFANLYHVPREEQIERIEKVSSQCGLTEFMDTLVGTYSGGIKKRLDIALSLIHSPRLLVLDEPTVGLDIESRLFLWKLLKELRNSGTTIIITSHYLEEIDQLADNLVILDQGVIIASGTPSQLKDELGGDRITVKIREFTPLEEAEAIMEGLLQLSSVSKAIINPAQGNSLNLVVTPDPQVLSDVQQVIRDASLPIFAISQSRPSLDDVFLAATGKSLGDADLENMMTRDLKKEKGTGNINMMDR